MGGMHLQLHVLISNVKQIMRMCVYPFSVSRYGRTNCAAIDVVRDTLDMCFTRNKRVVHLHVSTRVYPFSAPLERRDTIRRNLVCGQRGPAHLRTLFSAFRGRLGALC